jgi:FkbM family methyltransferase
MILIVYYIFINQKRDWKKIVKGQLSDLFITGLLAESKLCIHITDTTGTLIEECKNEILLLFPFSIEFRSNTENQFEYPGFKWMYELAQEYPKSKILYLHTKGMVYHHLDDRDMCEKTILRYTINDWKNIIKIFDENKIINKIGVYPSPEGWLWFNFFWIRAEYLTECIPPILNKNRYYYESYIGRDAPIVNKGFSDCYSLLEQKVFSYEQSKLTELIYDNNIYIFDMKRLPGGKEINIFFNKKEYSWKYGSEYTKIDITNTVYSKCTNNDIVYIPSDDIVRSNIFSDPVWGTHKYIFMQDQFGNITRYNSKSSIYLDLYNNKLYISDDIPEHVKKENIHGLLKDIHSKLKIKYVDFITHEYPEQCMSVKYIKGHEKVLEIGANVGRNTLIISYLLNDSSNLVSLECDPDSYKKLVENKKLNNLNFSAENSALSAKPLIQKDWDTIPSDVLLEGYKSVNTITLPQLREKYPLKFDTLVLDCEGAFYYILRDYPDVLDGIELIIMENDYHDVTHKQYLDSVLKINNFYCDYREEGGWAPCFNNFYEVWKKVI